MKPSARQGRLAAGVGAGAAAPYSRVKQWLKDELSRGHWRPGDPMPSESALVAQFGVSRMTVNRALRELQSEGLVDRVQGVGTFAAHRVSSTLTLHDVRDEILSRGHRHHLEVKFARQERTPAALAQQLGVAPGSPVFHSLVLHHDNGVPLQCEDRYVNPAAAPDYLGADFGVTTPSQYLMEAAPPWEAQVTVQAARPTAEEARLLGIRGHEPCLVVVRRSLQGGIVITLARMVHPGSRYQLAASFRP
jgi:GntR family histidine utilization transcriptional repressor